VVPNGEQILDFGIGKQILAIKKLVILLTKILERKLCLPKKYGKQILRIKILSSLALVWPHPRNQHTHALKIAIESSLCHLQNLFTNYFWQNPDTS
jgi:hypothetical protein